MKKSLVFGSYFKFWKENKRGSDYLHCQLLPSYILLLSTWNLIHSKATGLAGKASVWYDSTSQALSLAAWRTHFMGWDLQWNVLGTAHGFAMALVCNYSLPPLVYLYSTSSLYLCCPILWHENHRHLLMGAPLLFLWDMIIIFIYIWRWWSSKFMKATQKVPSKCCNAVTSRV